MFSLWAFLLLLSLSFFLPPQSAVLFLIDLSEECGYSIAEQVGLFHSLLVLFKNKEILVILNKTDKRTLKDLPAEERRLIQDMGKGT